MKEMKKLICIMIGAAMILSMAGCAKKTAVQNDVTFTDLQLGSSLKEVEKQLGKVYEVTGTTPQRLIYTGLKAFDFLGQDENTKLTVFLNTENNAYAYAFYMYDAIDGNYDKLKDYLTKRYGEPVEGENASEQWKDGDATYSVNKQSDYVAIGKF